MSAALLLDTHVWLWYAEGCEGRLSKPTLAAIEQARRAHQLHVSAISVWEIGMLCAKEKINLSTPTREWIQLAIRMPGLRMLALDAETAFESTHLPGNRHGDPADRIFIATARAMNLKLVTGDKKILDYGKAGNVRVLAA